MNDIEGACAGEVDEEQEARLAREALESLAAEKRLAELVNPARSTGCWATPRRPGWRWMARAGCWPR